MKIRNTLLSLGLFCSFYSSVLAQLRSTLISNECRGVITLDVGGYRILSEGKYGGHFGFNIENIIAEKFSFSFNVKDFVNSFTDPKAVNDLEHRLMFQPNINYYPQFALHGFYAQVGCGAFLYLYNTKKFIRTRDEALVQIFPDIKVGFQNINSENFAWNVYVGCGVFIAKRLNDGALIVETGVKLGLKY